MKAYITLLFIVISTLSWSQTDSLSTVLRFDEYLGYVKKFHPIVKQANLIIDEGQANLMQSRGAFDPKLEVDYARKKFKGTEYFDKLNGTFKIPTWYGVELKANFEENTGDFLNPEGFLPDDGLYSAGVSVSVAQGLLINDRMASVKQAKLYREQTKADRDILVNNILFDASVAYFQWLQAYNEAQIFSNFLSNAELRFQGIKRGVILGENAAIDSTEARIAVNSRKLSLEKARVKLMQSSLELSTFLWLENNIPVELQDNIIPDVATEPVVDIIFNINQLRQDDIVLDEHPKLRSLDYKLQSLEVDRRLKTNMLLPVVDLEYNFLTQTPDLARSLNTAEYKGGLNVSFPLFLRKERGALRLAKLKVQDTEFEIDATRVTLNNKIQALKRELESFVRQNAITEQMIADYSLMLQAEERKFQIGESSVFLVNTRESKLIDGQLKAIELQNKFFTTKAKLFNSLAINPDL
ncbi:MAG: TolC family protein [Winogradskyella sp.]|nr:TolC family protein [Winogradskyella sp.]MBT8375444.1 TolC family protein [Bacteroidia bacterium]NNC45639.1 TolC family protein [Winogradskyella sp.]NNF85269.1 TolC family protein [Winogradskyella sp.]NNK40230.1 TolC family protein [Winogradskyella sp.]